ncbi:helix-turn-helix transcriptional regulator, partial [bacterium]|nr:helix-turn-helix transcriptional regulator [bacterium]
MRLKELRKEKKLSQEQIAKILSVTQRTYGGYELETSEPSIQTL